LFRVGDVLAHDRRHARSGGRLVVGLDEPRAPADHLAERPERDALAVGGAPAVVPPDLLDEPVEVLLELPRQARLADPRRPHHAHEARFPVTSAGVKQVLEQPELLVPPDERRLERLAPVAAATLRHDAKGVPRRHRRLLAFQRLGAGRLERDGRRRGPLRRLAHQHGPGKGRRLEAARGVHEVARDHALVHRADRDRRLARQDARASDDLRSERRHGVDQLEPCTDRPLGVVLARDGRAPHGHHRISDELVDRSAVAPDDVR
jgi:hypothetical protein